MTEESVADPAADTAADTAADGEQDFGARVAALVAAIPPGRVMTYGQVAAALGSRASRQVGRVMAHEGGDLPWWRVVRAGGLLPAGHEHRALEHHRAEGTPLVQGETVWRVDMRRAAWSPATAGRVRPADPAGAGNREDSEDSEDPTLDPGFPRDPF